MKRIKNLEFRIKNIIRKQVFVLALFFILYSLFIPTAHAQTPSNWQNNATGLRTSANSNNKTGGLTTIIKVRTNAPGGIPSVSLQGGVNEGSGGRMNGPIDIDLGEIKNPGVISVALGQESADWSHDQIPYTTNLGNQFNLWISRLSPAILVQNSTTALRLFSGNVRGATIVNNLVTNRAAALSYPKYIAYSSGNTIYIQAIPASGATAFPLPVLDNDWILVWYGNNSHFSDSKLPLGYAFGFDYHSSMYLRDQGYQADAPMLLKFENNPTSIKQTTEGGIDLNFGTNSGYTSMMPLFGREHLKATDTEGWGTSGTLPANVLTKINFWNTNNRLCSYPTQVSETYAPYNSTTDTSTITENITYLNICPGGSTTSGFAILPPALALAKDAIRANITGTQVDAQYPTEFGPIIGIDNTNTYSWSVSGLKKYTNSKRVMTNPDGVPADLVQELTSQVDKVTQAGHYLPWIFNDKFPTGYFGDIYFANPADAISLLLEVAPVLPEPQKTNLIGHITSERSNFPPETVYDLPTNTGVQRTPFADTAYNTWKSNRNWPILTKVPLYNFFALSRYYELPGNTIPSTVIATAKSVLDRDMAEQDWASMSWFKGFAQNRVAVVNTNRHLNGLIGYVKLMGTIGDATESLGRALFTKAAVARIAMVKYSRYQYPANIVSLPSDPAWMPKMSVNQGWNGFIFNYNWTSGNDDAQQVVIQDQFGTFLFDDSGYFPSGFDWGVNFNATDYFVTVGAPLVAYRDMVPETFRLLSDFTKSDFKVYLDKYTAIYPNWYQAFQEGVLGNEHDLSHPIDSFQTFMAKVFIQNDTPQNLAKYADIPFLDSGDFFYMQKLAETIKAYQGWAWEDILATGPCTINSATWDSQSGAPLSTAQVGTAVKLSVSATGNCTSNIRFEVRRYGSTPIDDIVAGTQPNPATMAFINDQASTSWVTEFNPLIPFVTNPQYYFRVSLDNGLTWNSVRSPLLTVTQ